MKKKYIKGGENCCDNLNDRIKKIEDDISKMKCENIILKIKTEIIDNEYIFLPESIKKNMDELLSNCVDYKDNEKEINAMLSSNRLKKLISFLEITISCMNYYLFTVLSMSTKEKSNFIKFLFDNIPKKAGEIKKSLLEVSVDFVKNGVPHLEGITALVKASFLAANTILKPSIMIGGEDKVTLNIEKEFQGINVNLKKKFNLLLGIYSLILSFMLLYDEFYKENNFKELLSNLDTSQLLLNGGGKKRKTTRCNNKKYENIILKSLIKHINNK